MKTGEATSPVSPSRRTRKIYTLHRSLEADRVGSLTEQAFHEIMVAVCSDLGCGNHAERTIYEEE
jgi:hypothetical protein